MVESTFICWEVQLVRLGRSNPKHFSARSSTTFWLVVAYVTMI